MTIEHLLVCDIHTHTHNVCEQRTVEEGGRCKCMCICFFFAILTKMSICQNANANGSMDNGF